MYDYVQFFERGLQKLAKGKIIYDVGGGHPFQKHLEKYREWFSNCTFKTVDVSPAYNPDIVGDIHNLPIKTASADGILCMSVLEHIADPKKAVSEMHRILKKDGILLGWVPAIYPYHARKGKGAYPDNYRYFDDGLRVLFSEFSKVELHNTGGYFETMLYFLPAQKYLVKIFGKPMYALDRLFRTHKKTVTRGFYFLARK